MTRSLSTLRRWIPPSLLLSGLWALCLAGQGRLGTRTAAADPGDQDAAVSEIRTLFKDHCGKCHGGAQPKAGLSLVTLEAAARGSESGPVIRPGQPAASRLWEVVDQGEMPPDNPLVERDRQRIARWIAAGAPGLPRTTGAASHPAFRRLERPTRDAADRFDQARTTSDTWLLRSLARRNLSFSPETDRSTLLRRATLDLTGLIPSPSEIDEFLADDSPDAYERQLDRLLASPRYGERWGKHWLDAAGYADSNGYFSADTDRPLAYRYRDYVVRCVNADKPFDQFVREQLAGDELSGYRPGQPATPEMIELLEATHFLRNGQDGTDIGVQEPEAFEIDRRAALEAVVQVTASSLLGLTVHCARCHDHKFEPLTQTEYYQFQAIFFPAFNPQDWVNPKDRITYAYLPGEKEHWQQNEQRIKDELAALRRELTEWLAGHREPSELLLHESFADDSWKQRWSSTAPGDDHPSGSIAFDGQAPHAARVADGTLQVIAGAGEAWLSTTQSIDWTPDQTGGWVQATFDLVDNKVGGGPAERIGYTIAAHDYDDSSPLDGGNLLIDGNPTTATNVYRDYPGTDQKVIGPIGQQGYVLGHNYGVRVTNLGDGKYRLEHYVDGLPDGKSLDLAAADLPDGGFAFFYCVNRSYVVDEVRIERSLPGDGTAPDVAELRQQIQSRRKQYDEQRGRLEAQRSPEPGRAIAWVSDKSASPPTVPLLTRGLYHLRGPAVEPNAPAMLADDTHPYQPHALGGDATSTGRRLGLADWLTRPAGRPAALLARVHVNRVWRQYFGRGIVATTDNLGQSGASPTHPELLEELAATLIDSGWSAKQLHRQIVSSAAYRQASAARAPGVQLDPDNRWLWRWPVRRLEAEVMRDSMLAAAGQLDLTPYGPYVPTRQTPVGEVVVDEAASGARRRSVYLQQRRSQTLSLLKLFDAPAVATVCSTRPSSTVPLQSLALLNSDFAIARAEGFARRLQAETNGTAADMVQQAWRIATGRPPTANEQAVAVEFLAQQPRRYEGPQAAEWALADFCQMLLASNSFLYVE